MGVLVLREEFEIARPTCRGGGEGEKERDVGGEEGCHTLQLIDSPDARA